MNDPGSIGSGQCWICTYGNDDSPAYRDWVTSQFQFIGLPVEKGVEKNLKFVMNDTTHNRLENQFNELLPK